jgi:hypothetical protein
MTIGTSSGLAMAFKAKHEEPMTSRLLTSRPITSRSMTSRPLTSHPRRTTVPGAVLTTIVATILALAAIASEPSTAFARSIYDGDWSVLIVTQSGSCDATYRYGVQISDGTVIYDGGGPITMQGRVTPKGAVRVIVQSGSQWADGSGKMTRNRGGGVWRGQGMGSACSGIWQAERRE